MDEANQKFVVKVIEELDEFFGIHLQKIPDITVLASRKEIDRVKGYKTEPWVVAFVMSGKIYILDKDKFETESENHPREDFDKILRHEITHLYFEQMAGGQKPYWLSEGLACYVAEQKKPKPEMEDAINLMHYYDYSDKGIYSVGYFWVKYLIDLKGASGFIEFVKSIVDSEEGERYFRKIFVDEFGFGDSKESLEKEYKKAGG